MGFKKNHALLEKRRSCVMVSRLRAAHSSWLQAVLQGQTWAVLPEASVRAVRFDPASCVFVLVQHHQAAMSTLEYTYYAMDKPLTEAVVTY